MAEAVAQSVDELNSREKEKRWDRFRENRKDQSIKISRAKISKKRKLTEADRAAHGKVPLELLAREWLNEQNAGNEMRWYMVETLLPTLVVGLEKLLDEVSMRGLENTTKQQADFNPVNYIAQYLMRNNPRYSNFAEAHPYCRTMRDVSEQLKKMAYAIDENKLAELRAQTKLRREERDRHEAMKVAEEKRRRGLIKEAFLQWMLQSEDEISIGEVKLAVKSWLDLVSDHAVASTLPDLFSDLLTCEELFMREARFMSDMMSMTLDLPTDLFDSFVRHLSVCGVERRNCRLKELRRDLFSRVFSTCDPDKTGMVDRHRVLHLFSLFYDSNPTDTQDKLQNPKKWPIVEVIEDEELGDEEEGAAVSSTATTLLSEEEYQEFLSEGKPGACDEGKGGGEAEEVTSASSDAPKEKASTDDGGSAGEEGRSETGDKEEQKEEVENEQTAPKEEEIVQDRDGKEGGGIEETDEKVPSEVTKSDENSESKVAASISPDPQAKAVDGEGEKAATDESADTGEQKPVTSETKQGEGKGDGGERPPPSGSALERRMTAYGRNRAASVSLQRRLSGMSSAHPSEPTGPGHVWDHVMLNCPQFVQLIELFLGPDPKDATVDALSSFIRNNYTETMQERSDRLELAKQQALQQSRRSRVSRLFEVWDNDRSGYLELEELQLMLSRWRGFNTQQAIEHAEEVLTSLGALHKRLTFTQFRVYIDQLTEDMIPQEFDEFADYLIASVELTFEEQRRGERRREMLAQIQLAGRTSGLNFDQAMKSAVAVIHKDVAEFGGEKHITVGVATLVPSSPSPSPSSDSESDKTKDAPCLQVKAASSSIELAVVGKKLHKRFQRGVSYQAVDSNRPVHVANIQKHGGVHFFISEHKKEEFKGALVVSPIATPRHQVIGTVNVDSLSSYIDNPTINFDFESHEINFYQGVGVCLGEVYHWIEARQKLLLVAESALSWIHRRCPLVTQAAVYIVEPGKSPKDHHALRCMLLTSATEEIKRQNQLLRQGENLFRDYLFQCSENSESVSSNVYGEHHLAYPIRDHTGCAVAVVDFYMPPAQSLNRVQMREITRVLKLLTLSFYQLSVVPEQRLQAAEDDTTQTGGSTQSLLVGEGSEVDASVLFDQLFLADLQETMAKLDNRVFAEMRSYIDPPELVLKVIQALLNILRPEGEYDNWKQCKKGITLALIKAMQSYDPLKQTSHPKLDYVKQLMEDVPADSIKSQGSRPAKLIYSWVSICTSLLEHSVSLAKASRQSPEVTLTSSRPTTCSPSTPPTSAADQPHSTPPESAAATTRDDKDDSSPLGHESVHVAAAHGGVDTASEGKDSKEA